MTRKSCPPKALRQAQGKGFTLIELLIVIAIIAILAIIIIVAINPGKMLAKSRDSQRFSDVTSLATALNLYLADGKTFTTAGPYNSNDAGFANDNARKLNDGTGWIKNVDFTSVSSGAPLAALPLDPVNDATYHYTFGTDTTAKTYEIDSTFEHSDNTSKHASDGGDNTNVYEVGTDLTVLP